jgi:ElaB/YqjD/DUF883 family membrane-anchored ribosome-binding protein
MTEKNTADHSKELDAVRKDIQDLKNDMASLLKVLKSEGDGKLHNLKDKVSSTLHEKAESLHDQMSAARDRVADGKDYMKEVAEEHPFKTAVVALCLGLLTGAIIQGRR